MDFSLARNHMYDYSNKDVREKLSFVAFERKGRVGSVEYMVVLSP